MANKPHLQGSARPGVQSVQRALQLLRWVCASAGREGISLADLTRRASLSKPSVYRLLNSLEEFGLVTRDAVSNLYRPGPGLFELAHQGLEQIELRHLAAPELDALCHQTNETVHLAVLDKGEVVYLEKRESNHTIRMYSAVGRRAPVHCTGLGKAMLAFLPQSEQEVILCSRELRRYTPRTLTDREALTRELASIRERGYAMDLEEHEEDICCVAAPVLDHCGRVVAAMSVTMPAFRTTNERLAELGVHVRAAGMSVSEKLGQSSSKCSRKDS